MADQQQLSEHQRQQITAALQAGIDPHQQQVAAAAAAAAAAATNQSIPATHPQQHFQQPQDAIIQNFWNQQALEIQNLESDFKNHPLPLARIKKVMKTDHDVKVIILLTSFFHFMLHGFPSPSFP
jgi:nuclear transcription factor Y gamma